MNVNFSNITYTAVKEKRVEAFKNSTSLDSFKEVSIHFILKRFPFLGIFLIYTYFFIGCFPAVLSAVFN